MNKEFDKFAKSGWGLELWLGNKRIFRSKKSGVRGLLDFVKKRRQRYRGLVVFDKIVGRGAALLAVYLGAREVYGVLGSQLAVKVLKEHEIKYYFKETVPNILNRDKTGLCPFEKLSLSKNPKKFYNCLVRA